jgi:hypothetical protein
VDRILTQNNSRNRGVEKNAQIAHSSDQAIQHETGGRGGEIVDYVDKPQPPMEGDTTGSSPHGAI